MLLCSHKGRGRRHAALAELMAGIGCWLAAPGMPAVRFAALAVEQGTLLGVGIKILIYLGTNYYMHHLINQVSMTKTTLTLSESIAKTLKIYTAKTKNSLSAQSEVVEEALREFFERHKVKIEE